VICSVDYRALASLIIRLDGYQGAVLVEEMARGQKWDFEKALVKFDLGYHSAAMVVPK
jgi:hypothetical protein